jgi:hypothetical protein
MNHMQAVERDAELGRAERRVVEAAKKWDAKMHSDVGARIDLHEAVGALKRLESKVVDGSGK